MNVNGRRPAVERARPGVPAAHPPPPGPPRRRDRAAAGGHHRRRSAGGSARAAGPTCPSCVGKQQDAADRPAAGAPGSTPTAATSSGARSSPRARSCPPTRKAGEAIRGTDVRARRLQGPGALPGRRRAGGQGRGPTSSRSCRQTLPAIQFTTDRGSYDNDVAAGRGDRLRPAGRHRPQARPGRHGRRQQGPRAGRRPRRHRAEPRAGDGQPRGSSASSSSRATTAAAPPSTSARSWPSTPGPGRRARSPSAAR